MNEASILITPVSRATPLQEIVKSLTNFIMRRVWKPGDLIPSEKELAMRFQVGRSTVREVVKSLVVPGVLEAGAGEGSSIREPTQELLSGAFRWHLLLSESNLDDFVDVRVLVEVERARGAAANRIDAIIVQLEASPEDMVFTAFGRDLGTACTLFRRLDAPGRLGRQTQVWARIDGQRIVRAHVSMIDDMA